MSLFIFIHSATICGKTRLSTYSSFFSSLSLSPCFSAAFLLVSLFFFWPEFKIYLQQTRNLVLALTAQLSSATLPNLPALLSPLSLVDCSRINLCLFGYQFAALHCAAYAKNAARKKGLLHAGRRNRRLRRLVGGGDRGEGGDAVYSCSLNFVL